jgi:metallo-beta-lactamase family protein
MKITVHGAGGGEVTGSAYLVQTSAANVLVDLGLFQGARKVENFNRVPKKGAFTKLNAVVLTRAHLDHTGRLPLLTRAGYHGPIYATPATIDLTDLILRDSAHLQKSDVERQNRRRQRTGQPILDPLYEQQDLECLQPLYQQLGYDKATPLALGIGGLSGHAGQSDLLRWLDCIAASVPRVFLTHGEERGRKPLGELIEERFKLRVDCPGLGETIDV